MTKEQPEPPAPPAPTPQAHPRPGVLRSRPPTPSPRFEDFFSLADMQCIQDAFAEASGVTSCLVDPSGRHLTRVSRPTDLCARIIRRCPQGEANCRRSNAACLIAGQESIVRACQSAGLLEGRARIEVDGHHLANWCIGQVLDADVDPETIVAYGRDIGADEAAFREALARVPRLSRERFDVIRQSLAQFAKHISSLAARNFHQERLIADLRQAQAELKIRDRNLAEIVDFLPDPTLVVDKDGVVIFWNRALEKLTGVAAVDMLGKRDFAYGSPFYGESTPLLADFVRGAVSRPDARYTVIELAEDAIIAEVDLPNLPGGQRRIWAKAVALRDPTGRISGAIESIRDVTERHRAEVALRESEEKFRRIVETANEGVWVSDTEYRTTLINRRMATLLGYTPEELLGLPPERFVHQADLPLFHSLKSRRLHGHSDIYEMRLLPREGEPIWTLVSASPLYDATGRFLGSLAMVTDITDRKRVEEELASQRQRLEIEVERRTRDLRQQAMELAEANIRMSELDRLKSLFLSTVSHELRTPLTSILGFAKLIGRDFEEHFKPLAQDDPVLIQRGRRIGSNLRVVYNEAERLTRLINDVLDLSRIESGNMQWRDRLVDLGQLVRQCADGLAGLLAQRPELRFFLEVEETLPPLLIDPDQLIQVLTNLLQNAVKFTRAGEVVLAARGDGESVLLTVRDTGIGIPAEQLESIFDKFHQVRHGDTVDDTVKGTGLGLAICRQIVRHYGGAIWAESEPGRGSLFTLRLPVSREDGPAACTRS